jgi:hypothetical protein
MTMTPLRLSLLILCLPAAVLATEPAPPTTAPPPKPVPVEGPTETPPAPPQRAEERGTTGRPLDTSGYKTQGAPLRVPRTR